MGTVTVTPMALKPELELELDVARVQKNALAMAHKQYFDEEETEDDEPLGLELVANIAKAKQNLGATLRRMLDLIHAGH